MATKHFKIGEYCEGGVISAIATEDKVTVIQKNWDYSQGSRRSTCKIAKCTEIDRIQVTPSSSDAYHRVSHFLDEITSIGWADEIIKFIEKTVKLNVM